jgi:hypothetical protein
MLNSKINVWDVGEPSVVTFACAQVVYGVAE